MWLWNTAARWTRSLRRETVISLKNSIPSSSAYRLGEEREKNLRSQHYLVSLCLVFSSHKWNEYDWYLILTWTVAFYERQSKKAYKKVNLLYLLFGGISVPFKTLLFKYKWLCYKVFTISVFFLHILKHNNYLVTTLNKKSWRWQKGKPRPQEADSSLLLPPPPILQTPPGLPGTNVSELKKNWLTAFHGGQFQFDGVFACCLYILCSEDFSPSLPCTGCKPCSTRQCGILTTATIWGSLENIVLNSHLFFNMESLTFTTEGEENNTLDPLPKWHCRRLWGQCWHLDVTKSTDTSNTIFCPIFCNRESLKKTHLFHSHSKTGQESHTANIQTLVLFLESFWEIFLNSLLVF